MHQVYGVKNWITHFLAYLQYFSSASFQNGVEEADGLSQPLAWFSCFLVGRRYMMDES